MFVGVLGIVVSTLMLDFIRVVLVFLLERDTYVLALCSGVVDIFKDSVLVLIFM